MHPYLNLVSRVLEGGTRKQNRTGIDTLSTFGEYLEIDMDDGFPLLTTKRVSWKNIVIENLWFLSGCTDISFLKKHGVSIWDEWADDKGMVPSAYGNFWRRFPVHGPHSLAVSHPHLSGYVEASFNDQVRWVIDELKQNPMSRRLVVSAWAPQNAQGSKLPPCHTMWCLNVQNVVREPRMLSEEIDLEILNDLLRQAGKEAYSRKCFVEQRLNLHLTQRSADVALGVPYNIAGYAFILHLMARFSGLTPGIFAHSMVDAHIYTSKPDGSQAEFDHVPGLKQQLERRPFRLPTLVIADDIKDLSDVEALLDKDTETIMSKFVLDNYHPYEAIGFKVAV